MRTLIDRAKRGDQTARDELALALWPRLLSMAKYYARAWQEDPDDLVGEGWCALFAALEDVDLSIGQPECFLIERARWRMLDYLKWHRRRRDTDPPGETAGATCDLASTVVGASMVEDLAATLSETQIRPAGNDPALRAGGLRRNAAPPNGHAHGTGRTVVRPLRTATAHAAGGTKMRTVQGLPVDRV